MATFDEVIDACKELLKFFSVKEACKVASCSRAFCTLSKEEIQRRSAEWKAQTSRAWKWEDKTQPPLDLGRYAPADEIPIDDERALNCLGDVWRSLGTPAHLFDEISSYCGGWPRLLHSREAGAKPQPQIARGAECVGFTTLGKKPCPKALIFDIYCNDNVEWSAVVPLSEDYKTIDRRVCFPQSSNTLGDEMDASVISPFNYLVEPRRFFFSSEAGDTRSWKFNASLVTPKSFETLILSAAIEPKDIIDVISRGGQHSEDGNDVSSDAGAWEKDSGFQDIEKNKDAMDEMSKIINEHGNLNKRLMWYFKCDQHYFSSAVSNEKLWRCSKCDSVTKLRPDVALKCIDEDGSIREYKSVEFSICYWLDKRNGKKDRFHLMLSLQWNMYGPEMLDDEDLFSDILLNARKSAGN